MPDISTVTLSLPRIAASPHAELPIARRVRLGCLLALAAIAALTIPTYSSVGLTMVWPSVAPKLIILAALAGLSVYLASSSNTTADRSIADAVLVLTLMVALTNLAAPAQYLAVALKRPLIDPWLAAADAAMGVHVPALAAWTAAHREASVVLTLAYQSLLPQFIAVPVLLGFVYRDRTSLWEYCFHFYACAICTVVSLALFPAACAFLYYGFESTLPQDRFIAHFTGLRDGTFSAINFADIEGLISMPSFHVAGGLMSTWAVRRHRPALAVFAMLNTLLIAATVMSGAHYAIDVVATLLLFLVSVIACRIVSRT